jgi:hypothetical protein
MGLNREPKRDSSQGSRKTLERIEWPHVSPIIRASITGKRAG